MYKKILGVLLVLFVFSVFLTGCFNNQQVSSQSSDIASGDSLSSQQNEGNFEAENSSKIETSSMQSNESSSSKPNTNNSNGNNTSTISRPSVNRPSNNNSSKEEDTSSVSSSESVKIYENPSNLGLMCYSLSMRSTTAMGQEKVKRKKYFQSIVDQGYFNQYLLRHDGDLLDNMQIIAESGGSFWFQIGASSKTAKPAYLLDHLRDLERMVNKVRDAGYINLLNGFFYDEPFLGNSTLTNQEFADITKAIYQKFGLRMFAVFSTYEFTGVESNSTVNPDKKIGVVNSVGLKYLTDVGFDAYSTDVREGAFNGGAAKFAEWQANCSKDIVDGKTFYTEHRKLLQKKSGHPINFWHFPCAWTEQPWGSLTSGLTDEDYWVAHLDFMAQDLLSQQYPGGLCIYTFRRVDADTNEAFERHMDLKNEVGGWAVYDEVPKYENYCKKLRQWCGIFSSKKYKFVTDLDV